MIFNDAPAVPAPSGPADQKLNEVHDKKGVERKVNGVAEETPTGISPKLLVFFALQDSNMIMAWEDFPLKRRTAEYTEYAEVEFDLRFLSALQ